MLKLILLALLPFAAHAADVSMSVKIVGTDSYCSSWAVSGNTLTCIPSGGPPQPPDPPPGPTSCPGFTTTHNLAFAFGADNSGTAPRVYVYGFKRQDALVISFRSPVAIDTDMRLGVTHSGGAAGSSSVRTFVLSTKPCDFTYPAGPNALWANQANVMALRLSNGVPGSTVQLKPDTAYYLNILNTANGGAAGCGAATCDVFLSVGNP